jgi:Electron transfer DM13
MRIGAMVAVVFAVVTANLALLAGAQAADHVLATGVFASASGHATSGGVSIVRNDAGTFVVFDKDFNFDGAPDPKVGFGRDGAYDPASQLAPLSANKGPQNYPVPDSIDPTAYNEVYVWCEKYTVPLGVAKLK